MLIWVILPPDYKALLYRTSMSVVLLGVRGSDKSSASLILTWWQAGLGLKCQPGLAWEAAVALSGAGGEEYQPWNEPGDNETEKSWNGQSNCKSFTVHLINLETQSGVLARAGCCMVLTNCTVPQRKSLSDAFCPLKFKHVHISVIYIRRHLLVQHHPPSLLLWNVDVVVTVSLILPECI
jgi:hypothetical protein